jgi:hypothetical protein
MKATALKSIWFHRSTASRRTCAGVTVNVHRAQAKRTLVAFSSVQGTNGPGRRAGR